MTILLCPKAGSLHSNRGVIWASVNTYDRAISDFDTALRLWPVNFGILAIRGGAYADMGQHDNALADSIHSAQSFLHKGLLTQGRARSSDPVSRDSPTNICRGSANLQQ